MESESAIELALVSSVESAMELTMESALELAMATTGEHRLAQPPPEVGRQHWD